MPRDGTGQYNLPNPAVVTATAISSTDENAVRSDMATALSNSIAKDGQTVPTANLPMGGFKHTNVANGAVATDYATFGQLTTTNNAVTALTTTVTTNAAATQYRAPFLVNGGFDVWQNSTSLAIPASTTASLSIYAADRWCMETSANQASVVSRQTGTGTANYRARVQRNAGQTGTTALRFQLALTLPEVIALRGRIVTVSCTAQAGANFSGALRMKILTGTGTAGRRTNASSYTSEATPLDGAMAITTSSAPFSNVSTAISASATQAAIVFEWTPSGTAGAADLFEIQQVWLDFGAVAGAFPYEDDGATLLRCQKRFWKTLANIEVVSNAAGVAQAQRVWVKMPATMDAAPSVVGTTSAVTNANSFGTSNVSAEGFNVSMNSLAAGLVAYTVDAGLTASALL